MTNHASDGNGTEGRSDFSIAASYRQYRRAIDWDVFFPSMIAIAYWPTTAQLRKFYASRIPDRRNTHH